MSEMIERRPQIVLTRTLKRPNAYTLALDGEFRDYAFNEERGPLNRGLWRSDVFKVHNDKPVDLEIGTGNGVHFRTHSVNHPERCLVGIELKYKPLIQTIRGALRHSTKNARVVRFHAFNLDQLFENEELNDIYIHFPDPWTSPRKPKNRILNPRMLKVLFDLQRPGSKLDFKTDSEEAFLWSLENNKNCPYQLEFVTHDLHNSEMASQNVITQFERIFLKQGMKIHFLRLRKPHAAN